MKKKYLTLIFIALISVSFTNKAAIIVEKDVTVYVCGKSKIYHKSKYHSALKRCKSGISKMIESKAKKLGKRVCKCRG